MLFRSRCGRNLLWWAGRPPPALMLGLVLFVIAPSPRVWPAKGERVCRWAFRALVTQLMWEVWMSRPHIRSLIDTLAEWLRRRPAKPMGSPRVGSNPTGVESSPAMPALPLHFRPGRRNRRCCSRALFSRRLQAMPKRGLPWDWGTHPCTLQNWRNHNWASRPGPLIGLRTHRAAHWAVLRVLAHAHCPLGARSNAEV